MTRAECLDLARLYSQWPNTQHGDTLAYKIMDEVERTMYLQVVDINPALFWAISDKTYTANAESLALNETGLGKTAPFYRIVACGKPATGGYSQFEELYEPLSWNELDDNEQIGLINPTYGWHFDGTSLRVRQIPKTALSIRIRYIPFYVPGTNTTDEVFSGNYIMQQWGDLLALRVALRLQATRSVTESSLGVASGPAEQAFKNFLVVLQDQCPMKMGKTRLYETGGVQNGGVE